MSLCLYPYRSTAALVNSSCRSLYIYHLHGMIINHNKTLVLQLDVSCGVSYISSPILFAIPHRCFSATTPRQLPNGCRLTITMILMVFDEVYNMFSEANDGMHIGTMSRSRRQAGSKVSGDLFAKALPTAEA